MNTNCIEVGDSMLRGVAVGGAGCGPVPPMELMSELQMAHKIIRNALNLMTIEQKSAWAKSNAASGCDGDGVTRANEREAVLTKARQGVDPMQPNSLEVAGQMLRNAAAAVAGCGPVPPMEIMSELRAAMRTWDSEIGADTRTRTLSLRVAMRGETLGIVLAAGLAPGEVLSLSQARRVAQVLTSAADMAESGTVRPGTPLTVVMGG